MASYHQDVIFQVKCDGEIGTGFLISESIMITAFHVVASSQQGDEITLFNEKHGTLKGTLHLNMTEDLKSIDIAVLDVSKKISEPNYIKLALSENFPEGTKWHTRGFLSAKGTDGLNLLPSDGNTITSFYDDLSETRSNYDIDLSVGQEWDSYKGMSGSPLLVDEYAYGVITTETIQGDRAREITAISTKNYPGLIEELGIDLINQEILGAKSGYDVSANDSYKLIKSDDFRTLADKLKSVCQDIRKARIQHYSRSAINSHIELDKFPQQRVNSLKYRIFQACQKLLLTKVENGLESELTVSQIESLLSQFTDEAIKIISELKIDYSYPINNRESIQNAILYLISDCYLAFDEAGLYEEN